MESEEMGFLRMIASRPLDQAPRLAYADWLLEQGRDNEAARQLAEARTLPQPVATPPRAIDPPRVVESLASKVQRFIQSGDACEELSLQDRAILLVHFTSRSSATRQHIGKQMAQRYNLSLDVKDLSPAVKKALGR
jgi:uncharacterized protein (TIGR02996 family)